MKRDPSRLAETEFDLVVVGAGVYGAATAWDASLRGLKVALIDKGDFGSGTSFNNLKTVHGGIRYLQHADLKRMRESIRERRNLMRIAPHLVHPLPFLVPTYRGSFSKSLPVMRVALFLNDLVSWDRNRLPDEEKHLPAGRTVSRDECVAMFPGLSVEGLTGGVLWHDAQMHNSDRLTLSFVLSAAEEGAVVANYVEATGFLRSGSRVTGVVAKDHHDGAGPIDIRARLVVNAAGPWVDGFLEKATGKRERRLFRFSKAMNLVTRPVVSDVALGVVSRRPHRDEDAVIQTGGRFLCLIPWRDVTLVGTSHAPYDGEPDQLRATESDVHELLDDVNDAYPEARLERGDVRLIHWGLLPRAPGNGEHVTLLKTYRLRDHARDGLEGLLSVVGVKYTTARDVAEKTVDLALELMRERPRPSRSGATPVVGGAIEKFSELVETAAGDAPEGIAEETMRHLAHSYGTLYGRVLSVGDLVPVCETSPVLRAEIRHAAREEMTLDLASVVLRRTELGSAGHPGHEALEACAGILQEELSWSDERRRSEVEAVESFYERRS